jgi:hypothetical protein
MQTIDTMTRLLQSRPVFFRRVFGTFCLALGLSLSLSCAHSQPLHRDETGSVASEQKLPFHPETEQASASDREHPAFSPDPNATSALPFGSHSHTLPSGTLLTVQLENTLSAAKARAGDTFMASIAAPLAVEGGPLIDRGTTATGHIESVRSQAGSGYFQLTLSAITVEGRAILLRTSSLFAKGTFQQSDDVRVQKGRRLTFRLTSPVTLDEPKSMASGQSLGSPTE